MDRVTELLLTLAACLCQRFEDDGLPEFCFCGLVHGETAVADTMGECEGPNGMAWVRMASLYPAAGVGIVSETPGNCNTEIGLDIELGALRKYPLPNPVDGSPPSVEEMLEVTALCGRDAMAMWRAIACCDAITSRDYSMGTYAPFGPLGDSIGGTWSLAVVL